MEQTPEKALQIAYQKRVQVLEHTDDALKMYGEGREKQINSLLEETSNLNILSFAIVGSVLSFSPISIQNEWVLIGLFILLANALVLGIYAGWHQRRLNVENYEKAIKETTDIVTPYFDAYDDFIKVEPFSEALWQKQCDAYIEYLEQQKNRGTKNRIAEKSPLSRGGLYFVLFTLGFLCTCIGIVQKYYFQGSEATKVELTSPVEVNGEVRLRR